MSKSRRCRKGGPERPEMGNMVNVQRSREYTPISLRDVDFPVDDDNGLVLCGHFVPEEVLVHMLSFVPAKNILPCSKVCKMWHNVAKSNLLWHTKYRREYRKKPKKVRWYVYYCLFTTDYFDKNLLVNTNGQQGMEHWTITSYCDQFLVESTPVGAQPLPEGVADFNGATSCFATPYELCAKYQRVDLGSNLIRRVLDEYRFHIYFSEWVAGRFDCGSRYGASCEMHDDNVLCDEGVDVEYEVEAWGGGSWTKIEGVIPYYRKPFRYLYFKHKGKDTQFWAGHYGIKMAGAVMKILFDTIVEKSFILEQDKLSD